MRRLIAALIVLMVAHVVYAEDVPHGIVALPPGGKPIPTPILSHQKVSGVTVRWRWGSVETSDGVYDWSFYDRELPRVAAAGK